MRNLMKNRFLVTVLIIVFSSVTSCSKLPTETTVNNISEIKDGHTKVMKAFLNSERFSNIVQKVSSENRSSKLDNSTVRMSPSSLEDAKAAIKNVLEQEGYDTDTTDYDHIMNQVVETTMNYEAATNSYVPKTPEEINNTLQSTTEHEYLESVQATIDEMVILSESDATQSEVLDVYAAKISQLRSDYENSREYEPATEAVIAIGESSLQLAAEEDKYLSSHSSESNIPMMTWDEALKGILVLLADAAGAIGGTLAGGAIGGILGACIASILMTLFIAIMDNK